MGFGLPFSCDGVTGGEAIPVFPEQRSQYPVTHTSTFSGYGHPFFCQDSNYAITYTIDADVTAPANSTSPTSSGTTASWLRLDNDHFPIDQYR